VYWTSAHDGTVMKASIAGGGPAILASGQYSPDGIVVDSVNAYWIAGGTLWRVTTGGGAGQLLDTGGQSPAALVLAYPYLFIAFGDSSVAQAPSGGGALTPIVPAGSSPLYGSGPFAVDGTSVYGSDGRTIGKTPISGGTTITLVSGQNGVARMAVDTANIYWTATNDGTVMKAPLDGSGPPVALAVLQNYPTGIAVDSTSVYWTSHAGAASCAAGAVMKVAIGGGTPVVLAAEQPSADGVAVDAANVYWTTGGSQDPAVANGAVMKLPLE
jgi:sugar lactone lactonase YvrE